MQEKIKQIKYELKNIELTDIQDKKIDSMIYISGDLKNKNKNEIDKILVSIIFKKDKKIVGGSYSYITSIKDSKKVDLYIDNILDYDDYEINLLYAK